MKNIATLLIISVTTALLVSCVSSSGKATNTNRVTQKTLASGKITKLGYNPPLASWQCTRVAKNSSNWSMSRAKGIMKHGGGYNALQYQAISYANKNDIDSNYIYLKLPNQVSVVGLDVTAMSKTSASYYACKNPPAVT